MKKINICIIDKSFNTTLINFRNEIDYYFCENGHILRLDNTEPKGRGIDHGVKCAKIIDNCVDKNIRISMHCISIQKRKIQDNIQSNLILALRWCRHNEISIISMSIGMPFCDRGDEISREIKNFCAASGVVFAANNNSFKYTLPASLPQVISVGSKYRAKNSDFSFLYGNGYSNRIIKCDKYVLCSIPVQLVDCNSYATPKEVASYINSLASKSNKKSIISLKEKFFLPDFALQNVYLGDQLNSETKKYLAITNIQELKYKEGRNYLVVVDANGQWEQYKRIMSNYNKRVLGMAFFFQNNLGDDLPVQLQENSIVWTLDDYLGILEKISCLYGGSERIEEIPIVVIKYEERGDLFEVIELLQKMFYEQNYNCRICSDCLYGLLKGIPYIPESYFTISVCKFFVDYYSQDVLIYYREDESDKKHLKGDLFLQASDGVLENYNAIVREFG